MKTLATFLVILLIPCVCIAESKSHCKGNEFTYFSCTIKGSQKVVSLCGNAPSKSFNEAANEGRWLQYRFGKLEKIELSFPKDISTSMSEFVGEPHHSLNSAYDYLWFKNKEVNYSIGCTSSDIAGKCSVTVNSKELICGPKAAISIEFNDIVNELAPAQ